MQHGDDCACKIPGAEESALRLWLKATNKAGLSVPWAYTRKILAERWHIPPWEVDEAGGDEIALEIQLSNIEAECQSKK